MKDYPLLSTLILLERQLEQAFGQDISVIPFDLQAYGTKKSRDVQALVFLPDLSPQALAQAGNIAGNIIFHAGVAISLIPLLLEDEKHIEAKKTEAVLTLQVLAGDIRTSTRKRMAAAEALEY